MRVGKLVILAGGHRGRDRNDRDGPAGYVSHRPGSPPSSSRRRAAAGPQGVAYLRQKGSKADRLARRLGVWRRAATHAWHVHGPNGACTPASRNKNRVASAARTLVADANGVAFKEVSITIATQMIERGFYAERARESRAEAGVGAGITCGNIVASVYR